ncbi:MAG: hypothetical protein M5U12_23000 [Verrucomicrobia bacterium]|nr:hypothetical protein [Verrucomicrobiota bacterium]
MRPRHGEVWLADLGLAAKTRPVVVLLADDLIAVKHALVRPCALAP